MLYSKSDVLLMDHDRFSLKKIILLALAVRLILLPVTYHGDITVNYWWGRFAADFGLRGYYDWLNFGGYGLPDQPMLNIYYCQIIRHIFVATHQALWWINVNIPLFPSSLMTWYDQHGNQILLKVPMVLADLALVYLGYHFMLLLKKGRKLAMLVALIIALFPPFIYNSAIWGSGDSIINALALAAIFFILKKRYLWSTLLILSSLLYKPSLLIWLPVFPLIALKNQIGKLRVIAVTLFALSYITLISWPFTPIEYHPLVWFVNTMSQKILPGCMHQITANAMNFWAIIFGLNPRPDDLMLFGLISVRTLSLLICLGLFLLILKNLYQKYSLPTLLLTLANLAMISFTFLTRMHERYTFPALFPLLLLSFVHHRFRKLFIALTITHLINIYHWWYWLKIPLLYELTEADIVIRLVSLTNLAICLFLINYQLSADANKNT
ncbi:MAG: hypothetical protein WC686_02190 [Candidatus Shapirobacteria bacterium]|jgi:Gpi18-like mannosyltransferase